MLVLLNSRAEDFCYRGNLRIARKEFQHALVLAVTGMMSGGVAVTHILIVAQ